MSPSDVFLTDYLCLSDYRINICQVTLLEIVEQEIKNGDTMSMTAFEKSIIPMVESCVVGPTNRQIILNQVGALVDKVPIRGATFFYKTLLKVGVDIINSANPTGRWVVALTG